MTCIEKPRLDQFANEVVAFENCNSECAFHVGVWALNLLQCIEYETRGCPMSCDVFVMSIDMRGAHIHLAAPSLDGESASVRS